MLLITINFSLYFYFNTFKKILKIFKFCKFLKFCPEINMQHFNAKFLFNLSQKLIFLSTINALQ